MNESVSEPRVGLAVETSGRVGSVALGRGNDLLAAAVFSADRRHAVELLPTVRRLCRAHYISSDQLDELYVSAGPGSFTGLRIGITFAKTVALAGQTRVVCVPTLGVIAQNALTMGHPPGHLAVVLDAKRGRVYAAGFELIESPVPRYRRFTEPAEVEPGGFLAGLPTGAAVVGEGVAYHRAAVERSGLVILPDEYNRARAEVVYRLGRERAAAGRYDAPTALTPIYIRPPEAEEVYERRSRGDTGADD